MLSIVVPVYQVASTLRRCVGSICSQLLDDWELLLVDDGSTDDSPQICDELATADSHIRVFHQPNAGLSEARNTGISHARGEYITFVDSDDYLLPDTFAPLLALLREHPEYDILEYSLRKSSPKESFDVVLADAVYTDNQDYWLNGLGYEHTYACNKIFRASLFAEVRFPKGKVFEDAWFMPQMLQRNPVICCSSKVGYVYKWNSEGITSRASLKQKRSLLDAQMKGMEVLGLTFGNAEGDMIKDKRVGRLYMQLLNLQISSYTLDEQTVLPYRRLPLALANSLKTIAKILVLNAFGINPLCKLLN